MTTYNYLDSNYQGLKTIILFISSFGFAGSLNLLYIYTNELFPLSIKALTFGLMYLMSRAGGVAIPLFLSNSFYPIIMGSLSISCGYLMGKLPETLGKKLEDDVPETIRHYSILSIAPIDQDNLKIIQMSFIGGKKDSLNHEHFRLSFEKPTEPIALSERF